MRRAVTIVTATAAIALLASPAFGAAGDWYSKSQPLKATESGTVHAEAYGYFTNDSNKYANDQTWRLDPDANGHSVFVDTEFKFYEVVDSACHLGLDAPCWGDDKHIQTARWSSNSWGGAYVHDALPSTANRARGVIQVCEDISLRPDICSDTTTMDFSY
ncbi:hypothetical protein [Cellulomonas alba]|uniref:Ricin B lectin domain-containing protein n=1 Tax=Cellulomonas alba TaxID=3053467 RepID=A0ABT7SJ73_9CELL|nr:hypothetical protein [Cellulomonas alba]MDM7856241.1 hypothetical protein [Cellulomonas alba]